VPGGDMWRAHQYRRLLFFGILLAGGFVSVGVKLVNLQVLRGAELRGKAWRLLASENQFPGWRGAIKTVDGTPMAVTVPVKDVYCDLELGTPWMKEMIPLWSSVLGEDERQLEKRWLRSWLKSLRDAPYPMQGAVLVKRGVALEQWSILTNVMAQQKFGWKLPRLSRAQAQLRDQLRHRMLFAIEAQQRFYPQTNMAGFVIGHVQTVDARQGLAGVSGIEQRMNTELSGRPGIRVSEKDAAGRELPQQRRLCLPADPGHHVVLTIDRRIQQIAEAALLELAEQHHPRNASILVMRRRTGAFLAWACWPPFSLQRSMGTNEVIWLNYPLALMLEPGSVFKPFTLAAALSERVVGLDQRMHCGGGVIDYRNAKVRDHGLAYDLVTVRFGVAKSLNTLHAQLGVQLGCQRFFHYVTNFGFGQITGIALPGEMPGWIGARGQPERLPEFYAAFGQGISVTSLQLMMAWGALANDGLLMKPMLIARVEDGQGRTVREEGPLAVRQVISPGVAGQVREALEGVVAPGGTGRAAAMAWHTCCGKTGTAQQADGHRGYVSNRVCAFFFGMFPARDPELVIGVTVDEPEGDIHTGGAVAAPAFRRVAEQSAWVLNIPPDRTQLLSTVP
jgi:cell division protein FtsI (penicillin-binding protein 3)